jgi:hypothetical protein
MQNNSPTANFSPIDKVNYRFKTVYYLINICILLAFVGIIIKMVFTSLSMGDDQGPAFATMVGYIFTSIALFGLLMAVVSYYFKVKNTPSCSSLYPSFFQILALFIILFVIIRQSISFSKMINTYQVDPEYYIFSNYSGILIFFQIVLIYSYLQGNLNCISSTLGTLSKPSIGTLYLSVVLFILNILTVGIMEVILRLFSTCF